MYVRTGPSDKFRMYFIADPLSLGHYKDNKQIIQRLRLAKALGQKIKISSQKWFLRL